MPFAKKFRFTMRMPEPGEQIGRFTVESCNVGHVGISGGRYEYPVAIVVSGKGGQQGVRNDFKELLSSRRTTFSGYGNPYQMAFDKVEVESLGDARYRLTSLGIGNRIYLDKELNRFLAYISRKGGKLSISDSEAGLIESYLADYQADARRKNPTIPC